MNAARTDAGLLRGARRRTALLFCALALPAPSAHADGSTRAPPADASATPDLHRMLMGKLDGMNHADQGIFREDITASLAPYFPVGQPLARTRQLVAAQHLGSLRPFMGTNDPGMGKMYVTRFDLVSHMFAHVYVVLDFDFEGAGGDAARLKRMKAYLRASNM